MNTIIKEAPAKINLYLEITARRPDGYHDIESVMQSVSLCDRLTFTKKDGASDGRITLTCDDTTLACDSTNLVYRAAMMLFEAARIENFGLDIHIEKRIPMAAGLGGGSSDAATTLLAVNELYDIGYTEDELCRIGARLGADVPFCVKRGIAVTRGIGDIMSPCERLPDCFITVACAGEGVSTPWAYKKLDGMYDFSKRAVNVDTFTSLISDGDLKKIAEGMTNIFESAVLPEREVARMIREVFNESGALKAMMSGSGPSVIGIFDNYELAEKAKATLAAKGIAVHITKPFYPV